MEEGVKLGSCKNSGVYFSQGSFIHTPSRPTRSQIALGPDTGAEEVKSAPSGSSSTPWMRVEDSENVLRTLIGVAGLWSDKATLADLGLEDLSAD
jgi:hypothetical protein